MCTSKVLHVLCAQVSKKQVGCALAPNSWLSKDVRMAVVMLWSSTLLFRGRICIKGDEFNDLIPSFCLFLMPFNTVYLSEKDKKHK